MATLPYGAGSFGSGNAPYGVGSSGSPYAESANLSELQDLIDSNLLTPDEFAALPDKLRSTFGNYRLYASAWQMKRKGKSQAQDAYSAAVAGEDVIPSMTGAGSTGSSGRQTARFSVDAKPRTITGIRGRSTRIPETATGRDLSGAFKFRTPEERTAYGQSELQRKYDEAMFVPRMKEKATIERAGQIAAERDLATAKRRLKEEMRSTDKDVYATIERLLKSKDTKEISEGRRLKKEMDSLTEKEKKRAFTRERDDKKFDQKMDVLDKKHGFSKELLTERKDMAVEMQNMRQEDRLEYLGVHLQDKMNQMNRDIDEKSVDKSYASAYGTAKEKYDQVISMNKMKARHYLSIGEDNMTRAIETNSNAAYTEFEDTVKLLDKQRNERLEAIKSGYTPQGPIPGIYEIVVNGVTKKTTTTTVAQSMTLVQKGWKFVSQW